ncbi:GNAT family N-acetyltransferase [Kribbella sp. NPDC003557]|uniref:GNAT family N-acetyltransferase n=1 Tax=Kribbella sp. NPDC003557 TaxID=3154449 RepID=UPI0033A30774
MQVESYPEAAVPPALRAQVHELQNQAWPSDPPPPADAPVHDPALHPLSMLLVDEGLVVAALDVLRKPLEHGGTTLQAGGLSTVVTRETLRGRGYGHRLVAAARDAMADLRLDLGLFTCDRALQAFYESAGWQHLAGTVLIGGTPDDPFPSDQPGFDKVTLATFFTSTARQLAPTLHHARIELYPGSIDKLW